MTVDFSSLPDISDEHPELGPEERWYAAHVKARELALEAVFGATEPPDTVLAPEDEEVARAWPGGGFHRYAPRGERTSWLYVTHGLSQPFEERDVQALRDDPDALSGLGLEYPIGGRGALRHVLATLSPEYELDLLLPAGHCVLVHLVGVTDGEAARAQAEPDILGSLVLERVLYAFGVGGLTDPDRDCLTTREDFDAVWNDVRAEVLAESDE